MPVIGLGEKKTLILFQETIRINSRVEEIYLLTMTGIWYGDKFNSSVFMCRDNTMKEVMNIFWVIREV